MTTPGVGPLTAIAFRSSIDDPKRFKNGRGVGVYYGLTPRRFQSGERDALGSITKRGDRELRTMLYEAARSMLFKAKADSALKAWGLALAARKGRKIACVAVARRLAAILYQMWVSDTDFGEPVARTA